MPVPRSAGGREERGLWDRTPRASWHDRAGWPLPPCPGTCRRQVASGAAFTSILGSRTRAPQRVGVDARDIDQPRKGAAE